MEDKTQRIRELNDAFRRAMLRPAELEAFGRVVMTSGVAALSRPALGRIWRTVAHFEEFSPDNDPYGEHDFGALDDPDAGRVIWKIDYYDQTLLGGSEEPTNREATTRVLTLMLAHEY